MTKVNWSDAHAGNRAVGGQHERDARGHAVDGHRDCLPAGRERCSGPEHRLGVEGCRHQRRCRADFRGAERKGLPAGRVGDANVRRIDRAAATGTERTARPRLIRRCPAHGSSEYGNHGDRGGHDPGPHPFERSSLTTYSPHVPVFGLRRSRPLNDALSIAGSRQERCRRRLKILAWRWILDGEHDYRV